MDTFNPDILKQLYVPLSSSHKGQNGKLMIIGGSKLFHGASLWALKVASRIVDMVFYASADENIAAATKLKSELFDFIAVKKENLNDYIKEADAVLLGPGLPREDGREDGETPTRELVKRLLSSNPNKKWVLDAGAITEIDPEWLGQLNGNVIITPHHEEFKRMFGVYGTKESVLEKAKEYNIIILLKGEKDIVCSPSGKCIEVIGGNAGMTKGGTGDVLAGLVGALATKNDLWLAATAASYINKKAGESLEKKVGIYFNASDLADEIPIVMKQLMILHE